MDGDVDDDVANWGYVFDALVAAAVAVAAGREVREEAEVGVVAGDKAD